MADFFAFTRTTIKQHDPYWQKTAKIADVERKIEDFSYQIYKTNNNIASIRSDPHYYHNNSNSNSTDEIYVILCDRLNNFNQHLGDIKRTSSILENELRELKEEQSHLDGIVANNVYVGLLTYFVNIIGKQLNTEHQIIMNMFNSEHIQKYNLKKCPLCGATGCNKLLIDTNNIYDLFNKNTSLKMNTAAKFAHTEHSSIETYNYTDYSGGDYEVHVCPVHYHDPGPHASRSYKSRRR